MLAAVQFYYSQRTRIPYRQWRPYPKVVRNGRVPAYGDCSGSGAGCAWGVGTIPNFNGYPWGYGNTWSQVDWFEARGRRIEISQAEQCDPVYYRGHVAWVVGWDLDAHGDPIPARPRCFSFGSYPARVLSPYYRTDIVGCYSLLGKGG